jgi:CheY-like chemotaxis protein
MSPNDNRCPILVAEDNADDLFFLKRGLKQAGLENPIVAFENGQRAVQFLRELCASTAAASIPSMPCVLFLDIKMPLMSGFEVLAWARAQPALARLPIVMLSGSAATTDVVRATQLGANEYLVKPPAFEALLAAVRRACDSIASGAPPATPPPEAPH